MNRLRFSPRFWLFLLTLILGQVAAFGQYYPPAVMVSDLDSSPIMLTGGGGSYSGGYYYTYSYDTITDTGYWNYTSYGHHENQDLGYWDTSPGHYADQGYWDNTQGYVDATGNWVTQPFWVTNYVWVVDAPVWVSNPVSVWVYDPTWVVSGTTTVTQTATAYVSITLSIDGSGNCSLSANNNNTGNVSGWYDSYNFFTGSFAGNAPTKSAVNTDGTSWSPPPAPPSNASFGPSSIWIEGTCYSFSYTEFTDSSQISGTDNYVDGAGHTVWFKSVDSNGVNNVGGNTPLGASWIGTGTNGIFESTGGVDVRAADSGGNYILGTAPSNLPPAIRVDGSASLWNFLGQGASLYHYAGLNGDQRLTIDSATGLVSIQGDNNNGFYNHNVIWSMAGGRDVRAVSLDGSLYQTDLSPSWGPPDVLVNHALWRYVGTWDGSVSFPSSSAPMTGDHYLGDNNGQCLVVNAAGTVTVISGGVSNTGTYAQQAQQAGAPRVFTVSGYTIYPGDENGAYHNTTPGVGPPAVWVNGITFAFSGSNEDASQLGSWVDTYVDGDHNFLLVGDAGVWAFQANGSSNWSGYYTAPASGKQSDGGIFVVVSSGSPRYDVRSSNGVTLLPPQGSPQSGHPSVVKVDGVAWKYAGSALGTDYYFGASAGERLWIDSSGVVSFTNTVNSPTLAGSGNFSGSVFLMQGHDLRACTSDPNPVAPVGTHQWGPALLAVEGVVWNFIGSVSDDTLQVHADYYGGMNAGQVVSVNSAMQVSGAYTGVFDGGVFVVNGRADLRALDATGAQIAVTGTPLNGYPTNLRIGGLHWDYLGSYGGQDYYAATLGGQRLSIDASGAVIYSDHPHHVNNATGTYAGGIFTSTSGGMSFNAGTIGSDLDILGNIVSFGALLGNTQIAGVTLQFMDDGTTATLQNGLGRPQARWRWNRAASNGSSTGLPVMQLDAQGRLNLYDPATASTPQVEPTISLSPGVEMGVQVSKLPKLELSQQTLDSGGSVLTKALADIRYLQSAGDGQNLSSLTVTGAATVTGSMTVAGSPVLTQAGGDARYLQVQASAPVVIANGATISGASQLNGSLAVTAGATITGATHVNGALNTTGDITSNANAEFKGNVVMDSSLTVRGAFVGPPTDRKVIMQTGKSLLIPESGDISMGGFRAGPLPDAVTSP